MNYPAGTRQFLKLLYRKHPPKDGQQLGDLGDRSIDRTLKSALVAYHHDKQAREFFLCLFESARETNFLCFSGLFVVWNCVDCILHASVFDD